MYAVLPIPSFTNLLSDMSTSSVPLLNEMWTPSMILLGITVAGMMLFMFRVTVINAIGAAIGYLKNLI